MRRPPAVLAVRSLCALLLIVVAAACNDKISDVGEDRASAETTPELIPFATDDDGSESNDNEPPETEPEDTEAEDTEPDDTEPEDTEPDDTEADDTAVEIDPMPGDTATFDTRPDDDPLCEAAQSVVSANTAYQKQLDKALKTSPDKPQTLSNALQKLPIERLRDAYDDLAAEVPSTLRRRVATIRDFTVEHGEKLAEVEDFEQLSELIADIESDPAASKVTKANLAVSKHTEDECGIRIAQASERGAKHGAHDTGFRTVLAMDFAFTPRTETFRTKLLAFMDECIYPSEAVYEAQLHEAGDPHAQPRVMEELKREARSRGLWNLFHPHPQWGPGLSNMEYAPLAEILGRSPIASEACNCSAPDTGNMEVLTMFGTPAQHDVWLRPLLEGEMRSVYAMTEPDVASSDATNVAMRIERDGDSYVLNGRKWWISGVAHPNGKIMIVMGKTDPAAPPHRQQSQILVPLDTPGLTVVRALPTFGYQDQEGHVELVFDNVRVPASNLIADEGDGFAISQARLGPGRIHHCMRSIGAAERALELLCTRALSRSTFGKRVAERSNIMDWIAESRIEIEMTRLLTLKTAWLMDTVGNKAAAVEISAIKVAGPNMALRVMDRAIQVHGAMGMCDDTPLPRMWVWQRALRFADGPDEVHKMTIARRELRRHDPAFRAG